MSCLREATSRLLTLWLLLAVATVASAGDTVIPAAKIAGAKAFLGDPAVPLVMIPEGGLTVPIDLPPGHVRITAKLRFNGKGTAFRETPVWMWVGPQCDAVRVAQAVAGDALVLELATRRPGPAVLHLSAAEMPPAAAKEFNALRNEARLQEHVTELAEPKAEGFEARLLDEELPKAKPPDAAHLPLPTVLVECITVASQLPASRVPEIANVVPYFRVESPFLLLGENLDAPGVEVWSWQPPAGDAEIAAGAEALSRGGNALPAQPPPEARRAELLDTDVHSLLAELPGDAVWVRNRAGWSKPYLCNAAMPFWLSQSRAEPGALLFLYGYGLRRPGGPCHVLLSRKGEQHPAEPVTDGTDGASDADRYLAHFRVPRTVSPGTWDVFVSNGIAGRYGWVRAGVLEVTAPATAARVFNVTDFGADGSDRASDRAAVVKAMGTAAAAGGGIVRLPPGRYLVEETLTVPAGVVLRGAGRDTTALEGVGFDPALQGVQPEYVEPRWVSPLLVFGDRTGVEDLRLCGAVGKGPSGFHNYPMLLVRSAQDVRIERCIVDAAAEEPTRDSPLYGYGVWVEWSRQVRIADNILRNGMEAASSERVDILRNHVHSALSSVVSMFFSGLLNSRIDSNRIADRASRFCPIAGGAHLLIRRNELHHKFIGEVASGEGFLMHGDIPPGASPGQPPEVSGTVSAATADTLTDRRLALADRVLRGATVQILSGRGFGQYRVILGNTKDTMELDRAWVVVPDRTSRYLVRRLWTEVAMIGNLNNSQSYTLWWYDWTGCVVEKHRDVAASAMFWGGSALSPTVSGRLVDSGHPGPSWFNLFYDWDLDGGFLTLEGHQAYEPLRLQAPLFANFFVKNRFQSPKRARWAGRASFIGCQDDAAVTVCPMITGMPVPTAKGWQNWPSASHTVFAGNRFTDARIGFRLGGLVRKTFLLNNEFDGVGDILLDAGAETVLRGNRKSAPGADGKAAVTAIPDARNPRVIKPVVK